MIPLRLKIILSNSKEAITIREEELQKVLEAIAKNQPVIVQEGIFNPSYFVAIVPDKERMNTLAQAERYRSKFQEPSPFAKLIAEKMEMLSPGERTKAQEEAAKEERKLRR